MFGLFGNKSGGDEPPQSPADVKKIIDKHGVDKAGVIIRRFADEADNITCQIFMSQAGLFIPVERRTEKMHEDIWHYTGLAANSGDPGSQYNFAKLFINKLNPAGPQDQEYMNTIRAARYWHSKAARAGISEAAQALKDLSVFPE